MEGDDGPERSMRQDIIEGDEGLEAAKLNVPVDGEDGPEVVNLVSPQTQVLAALFGWGIPDEEVLEQMVAT